MLKTILVFAILGGLCGVGVFNGGIQPGVGHLVLKITDAPDDLNISHANITISQIQVHRSAFGNNTSAGWFTVVNNSQTFDLVSLHNVTALLGNVNLSSGWYTQIRLTVEKAMLTINGSVYNCKIPSKTIKLVTPFRISGSTTTTLTLDLNIQRSVHQTGSAKYIFRPTIRILRG